jgi:hypothetical protein
VAANSGQLQVTCAAPQWVADISQRWALRGSEHEKEQQDSDEGEHEAAEEAHIEDRGGVLFEFPPPDGAPEPPPATIMTAEVADGENGSRGSLDRAAGVRPVNVRASAGGTAHDLAIRVLE